MTGAIWKSACVAVLFALHPLHVESVAWIAERKDVLSTFFWIVTTICYVWYVRQHTVWRYFLVVIFFILGIMSKPMVVTLPFTLFLLDFWPLKRFGYQRQDTSDSGNKGFLKYKLSEITCLCIEKIPLIIIATIISTVTIYAHKKVSGLNTLQQVPLSFRFINAIHSYVVYLIKMIYPIRLSVYYILYPYYSLFWPMICAFFLVSITILVLITVKRFPYLVVGWLWYLITLVPVIGIVQIGSHSMADRFTYIPSIGIFLLAVWGISDLFSRWHNGKLILKITSFTLLVVLLVITWIQVSFWKSPEILFRHAIDVTEDNWFAHYNLGKVLLFDNDDMDGAIEEFQVSLKINPMFTRVKSVLLVAFNRRGLLLLQAGKIDSAVKYYDNSLQIDPHQPVVYYTIGNAYLYKGNTKKAIEYYQHAIDEKPDYTNAIKNLEKATIIKRNIESSISNIKDILKSEPNNAQIHSKLGDLFLQQDEYDKAISQYKEALSIQPRYIHAIYRLAGVYYDHQEYTKALDLLQNLKEMQPQDAGIYYYLACIYAKQDILDVSVSWLKQAIDKGFSDWDLIKNDPDLENIKNTSYVTELMNNHKPQHENIDIWMDF